MEQWLVADAKASGLGTGCAIQAFTMWKLLSASEFARMAGARAISWQTVEARIQAEPFSARFRYESETGQVGTLYSIDALVQMAQAVFSLQLPCCVQREDVADFIPTPGEWTYATPIVKPVFVVTSSFPDNSLLDDRKDELHGFAPPIRVIIADIAQNMNDNLLAAQFVRTSLQRHHNPVKLCQSYTKLGELLMKRGGEFYNGDGD
jgi:hypothetical protein